MNLLDRLAADLNRADNVRAVIATVTSVGPGRLVDLDVQGGAVTGIPVSDAYPTPTTGDTVFVVKTGSAWLALVTVGKTTTPGGPNLLSNPSFEYGTPGSDPSDWSGFWTTGTATAFKTASDQKHSGTYSAKGGLASASASCTLQTVSAYPITPSTLYKFSFWYRVSTAMPSGSAIAGSLQTAENPDGAQYFSGDPTVAVSTVGSTLPSVAGSWRYVEASWTSPTSASGPLYIRPDVMLSTGGTTWTGSVWVDDVSLRTA